MFWQGLLGLICFPLLAWLLSENRRGVNIRIVLSGLLLQIVLAVLLLNLPWLQQVFEYVNRGVLAISSATEAGTGFVFGYLGGGEVPFVEKTDGAGSHFILAFRALPLVLVMSALASLLFYWRVLPWLVRGFGWLLQRGMGLGGALGLGAAANVFVGMVEAPLLVRPYLKQMERGELFALMACGMATIAGTMMAIYATLLDPLIPGVMGHLLIASLLSAPAAITLAQLMVPTSGRPAVEAEMVAPVQANSSMEAVTRGTLDGVPLLLNIVAMLIVLVALVALVNQLLGLLPEVGGQALTLERLLGWLLAPLAWLMGIPWNEAQVAGSLMGTKTVLNEFIAYLHFVNLPEDALSPRSELIMTYALCGFANLGSLGIMLGGLGTLVPERREEIVALGLKSIVAGTLATAMTGALVGLFQWHPGV